MVEMTRENAKEIPPKGFDLQECVEYLLDLKEKGESVFVNVNGHKLYSCDVTMDSAYLEVTGKTKEEFDMYIRQRQEQWAEEREERAKSEKAEAEAKIPMWIEKGKKYIHPDRMEKWKKTVEDCAKGMYGGLEIESALSLMEKLENGASIEEVKDIFETEGYSASGLITRRIMLDFAKKGPEFFESTATGELSKEDKEMIQFKKDQNDFLEAKGYPDLEEQEISDLSKEKERLTFEINDIENQIEELRSQEVEMKKTAQEKQVEIQE